MRTTVVSRKIWLRGEGTTASFLLRESDRKMCCFGIDAVQFGIPNAHLLGVPTPAQLALSLKHTKGYTRDLFNRYTWNQHNIEELHPLLDTHTDESEGIINSWQTHFAMQTNDRTDISDHAREAVIEDMSRTYLGIQFVFVD